MVPGSGRATFKLRNDLAELDWLGRDLEAFGARAQLPSTLIFAVNLALEEVITNTISYGYEDAGEHVIDVDIGVDDTTVVVTVEDDGRPFDPLAAPEPDITLPLEERPVGGLGVLLVRKLMDQVTYARAAGKNVLVFKKQIETSSPTAVEADR